MRVCVRCRSGTATHKINHFLLLVSIGSGAPGDLNVFHQPKDTSGWRILTDQFNLGGFLIQSWVLAARKVPETSNSIFKRVLPLFLSFPTISAADHHHYLLHYCWSVLSSQQSLQPTLHTAARTIFLKYKLVALLLLLRILQ